MRIVVVTARRELGDLERALARHVLERVEPRAAIERIALGACDLVLVDAGDGAAELCERIRAAHRAIPVLAVTPEGDVAARVRVLEQGADDAVARPWAPSQMAARVDALGRRAALVPADPERIEQDGCAIDLARATCRRDGRDAALTALEVQIVRWLSRHRGRAVGRAELLEHVWGVAPTLSTRAVDVAISALRKKIERDPERPRLIVSVRGVGYSWGDLT
jgi:two-component system OmpR family response regulator